MSVDADGFVKHCGNLNMAFGKIQESEIMDLWHNELMVKLRKKSSCNCSYGAICSGGALVILFGDTCMKCRYNNSNNNKKS